MRVVVFSVSANFTSSRSGSRVFVTRLRRFQTDSDERAYRGAGQAVCALPVATGWRSPTLDRRAGRRTLATRGFGKAPSKLAPSAASPSALFGRQANLRSGPFSCTNFVSFEEEYQNWPHFLEFGAYLIPICTDFGVGITSELPEEFMHGYREGDWPPKRFSHL